MGQANAVSAVLRSVAFADLPGWTVHDHEGASHALRRSCREILETGIGFSRPVRFGGTRSSWLDVCREAMDARNWADFFENRFRAFRVVDEEKPEGLFTGYFEPVVQGSRRPGGAFRVPLYRRPPDLVQFTEEERLRSGLAFGRRIGGKPIPYHSRREIEEGVLEAQDLEFIWLKDWAEAFFIHVQGSGRVELDDGTTLRLAYEAKSGLPYTSIGSLLVGRGILGAESVSLQTIRSWMAEHPREARELMWENQSFVFFREAKFDDPELGSYGAQHVQLTPRRSLAVDRSLWMFGTPVWLDTAAPAVQADGMTPFRQLLIAQDTGSAIRGAARGDVYWGFGEEAAEIAGPMKSPGTMTVLLPVPVAEELGLPS
ncbi:murein transglycosylase A [Aestuariivirga sp.]|uniref:murein transglycosylase A n=1 Tax=Aestuariivirga sp. TaxID=2650926 RepID=UPI00391DD7D3